MYPSQKNRTQVNISKDLKWKLDKMREKSGKTQQEIVDEAITKLWAKFNK